MSETVRATDYTSYKNCDADCKFLAQQIIAPVHHSNTCNHHGYEYVGGSIERFGSCCCHSNLHHPGHFSNDALHDPQMEQR